MINYQGFSTNIVTVMKFKILKPILSFLALFLLTSIVCNSCDNFLTPDPASFTSTDNFYKKPGDFELALNGVYNRMRAQAGISNEAFMTMTEIRFDAINRQYNVSLPGDAMVFEEWHLITSNPFLQNQWSGIYNTIAQANMILNRIEDVNFENESQKDQISGEAKFLRALSYWYAVQFWGDVPLVINEIRTPSEAAPEEGRSPVSEVYNQIITDLQEAIEELPSNAADPGRASEGAAKLLLGKTYLLTEDYPNAIEMLESVESDYGYMLLQEYIDIWDPENTNNSESIFELQFGADIAGQPQSNLIAKILPWSSRGEIVTNQVNPEGWYHPSLDLLEMFEDTTTSRFKASIDWYVEPGNAEYPDVAFYGDSIGIINKFFWPDHINDEGEQAGNDILFRYSDALLSLAEAYWREDSSGNRGTIESLLNRVRNRAGLPNIDFSNVHMSQLLEDTYLENDNIGRAIFNERAVELFAEGHRYFDLKRFDVANQVMINYSDRRKELEPRVRSFFDIQPYKFIFPIPSREIDLGGFEQNPEW